MAGDTSGDQHAARLIDAIRQIYPDAEFDGIAGPACAERGLKSIAPLSEVSVVGFWEVAKKYFYFRKLICRTRDMLSSGNYSAFIPVDYPGFNMIVAKYAKGIKVPVYWYIAPQLWVWGRKRAAKLAAAIDVLLCVFPFEVDFFKKFGIRTKFVGHPILDDPAFSEQPKGFEGRKKLIAFMPGSRRQEIMMHMPLLEGISDHLSTIVPDIEFGIAAAPSVDKSIFTPYLEKNKNWAIWDNSKELMASSLAGVVKTGTSNLEACLSGLPFAMIYKTSPFTFHMGKFVIKLPFISIVNILANKPLVHEFIQDSARAEIIAEDIAEIIKDRKLYDNILAEFNGIRTMLGDKGAAERAAACICNKL